MRRVFKKRQPSAEERFWSHVIRTKGCWLWRGTLHNRQYGRFRKDGVITSAHCFSYELHKGAIPAGMCICHTCDNPPCVRPDHLFLGSTKDNAQDREKKKRGWPHAGEKCPRAKLSNNNVYEIRKLYAAGTHDQKSLAALFGVHQASISHIVTERNWKSM